MGLFRRLFGVIFEGVNGDMRNDRSDFVFN